jgi:hypothetical protein
MREQLNSSLHLRPQPQLKPKPGKECSLNIGSFFVLLFYYTHNLDTTGTVVALSSMELRFFIPVLCTGTCFGFCQCFRSGSACNLLPDLHVEEKSRSRRC